MLVVADFLKLRLMHDIEKGNAGFQELRKSLNLSIKNKSHAGIVADTVVTWAAGFATQCRKLPDGEDQRLAKEAKKMARQMAKLRAKAQKRGVDLDELVSSGKRQRTEPPTGWQPTASAKPKAKAKMMTKKAVAMVQREAVAHMKAQMEAQMAAYYAHVNQEARRSTRITASRPTPSHHTTGPY